MNNRTIGVGTLVPLVGIEKNGTEVPTPSKKQNGAGVLTLLLHDKHGTKVSTPNSLFEIGSYI